MFQKYNYILLEKIKEKVHMKIFESSRRDQTGEASLIEAFYPI